MMQGPESTYLLGDSFEEKYLILGERGRRRQRPSCLSHCSRCWKGYVKGWRAIISDCPDLFNYFGKLGNEWIYLLSSFEWISSLGTLRFYWTDRDLSRFK
jgi:hypothetical protein